MHGRGIEGAFWVYGQGIEGAFLGHIRDILEAREIAKVTILPAIHHAEEGVSKFRCGGGKPMHKSMRRSAAVSCDAEENLCGGARQ